MTKLIVLCVCAGFAMASHREEDHPVTTAPSGQFLGSWMQTRRGRQFEAYRGIRYAEPPVGELRFQPPKPILHYADTVDATEDGPACPQVAASNAYIDEDCLRINVYTPGKRSQLLPVIFYIHPGGFYSFSGTSIVAGPQYLLDRDVVLVTINYRLASLGFLSLNDPLAPGNNGLKDQVIALRWAQRHLASFGGDPARVTLAGCSAGATSAVLHTISPMSQGLFHQVIAMSGSPTTKVPTPSHRPDLALKQAKISNCPSNNPRELLECLKTKSWQEIAGSLLGFFEFGYDPLSLWRSVVEPDFGQERFLSTEPMDAIRQERFQAVPVMLSQTRDEFFWKAFTILKNKTLLNTMDAEWSRIAPISFILPRNHSEEKTRRLRTAYLGDRPLRNDSQTKEGLGKLYADAITGFSVYRLSKLLTRHSSEPIYFSRFDYIGNRSFQEDPITKKPLGVAHHDDVLYVMPMTFRFPIIPPSDSTDSHMVDKMTAVWYNFARYGNPNPCKDTPELKSLSWPRMTAEHREYLRFDKQFSVHEKLYEDRFKVWDELYPIAY